MKDQIFINMCNREYTNVIYSWTESSGTIGKKRSNSQNTTYISTMSLLFYSSHTHGLVNNEK